MIIAKDIITVNNFLQKHKNLQIGFVPTMGFLHDGHLSLIKKSQQENDLTAVSIFVNPIQFNQKKDFQNYPTNLSQDLELLTDCKTDLVFLPSEKLIYPNNFNSKILVSGISEPLEGGARPGHFDGVTTIVAKFFNIIQPDKAYFGEKDAQQLLVIKKMVNDLNYKTIIVKCPTIREKDGLAMSSRNSRLNQKQRNEATVLHKSLTLAKNLIKDGETDPKKIIVGMNNILATDKLNKLDYISINKEEDLSEVSKIEGNLIISLAVFFGDIRLIDNIWISI